jgi:short-subunit dehydrogenase
MKKPICTIVGLTSREGYQLASKFANDGFEIAVISKSGRLLDNFRSYFNGQGYDFHSFVVNSDQPSYIENAIRRVRQQLGETDVLIYNDTVFGGDVNYRSYGNMYDIKLNCDAALRAVNEVIPYMHRIQKGMIFFTGYEFSFQFANHPSTNEFQQLCKYFSFKVSSELETKNIRVFTFMNGHPYRVTNFFRENNASNSEFERIRYSKTLFVFDNDKFYMNENYVNRFMDESNWSGNRGNRYNQNFDGYYNRQNYNDYSYGRSQFNNSWNWQNDYQWSNQQDWNYYGRSNYGRNQYGWGQNFYGPYSSNYYNTRFSEFNSPGTWQWDNFQQNQNWDADYYYMSPLNHGFNTYGPWISNFGYYSPFSASWYNQQMPYGQYSQYSNYYGRNNRRDYDRFYNNHHYSDNQYNGDYSYNRYNQNQGSQWFEGARNNWQSNQGSYPSNDYRRNGSNDGVEFVSPSAQYDFHNYN